MEITLGNLVDQLATVCNKIFILEDIKRDINATDSQLAEATRKTNTLNVQRHQLIQAIDKSVGVNNPQGDTKMYGKH